MDNSRKTDDWNINTNYEGGGSGTFRQSTVENIKERESTDKMGETDKRHEFSSWNNTKPDRMRPGKLNRKIVIGLF